MARIAGVDLPRNKRIEVALTYIYGVGDSRAKDILEATAVDPDRRTQDLTDEEVAGLRDYLLAGGFLVVDDFWGTREWANFERNIRKVFPSRPIVELPRDHPVFRSYYQIDELVQVPAVNNILSGRTWEQDGYTPHARGIFDEDGRLMVAINWNTDLGDAWEWADNPYYPLEYSSFAFEMGVNFIIYAMTH